MKLVVKLFLIVIITMHQAHADMYVKSIHESSGVRLIIDNGKKMNVHPLTFLDVGNKIVITKEGSYVELVGNDGSTIKINYANSPFIVPASKRIGWISNLSAGVRSWIDSSANSIATAKGLIGRGELDGSVNFNEMDIRNNYVTDDIKELFLSWSGCVPPYRVVLEGVSGKVYVDKTTRKQYLKVDAGLIAGKKVLAIVTCYKNKNEYLDAKKITSVANQLLPEEVTKLMQSRAPEDIKNRLAIVMLSRYPQWKFQASQFSRQSKVEK